jgi:hypothetical protein
MSTLAQAASTSVPVDALMAVYTYNFAKFTDWPPTSFDNPDSPLNFCLLGENPFDVGSLAYVVGKKVKNHPVIVYRYPRVAAIEDCHIVFVSRSEHWRLVRILADLQALPVLTVSDIPDFSRRGGIVTFIRAAGHLQFDINQAAARRAGLTISSKLLELARNVSPARLEELK